jgi:hypothetical protein
MILTGTESISGKLTIELKEERSTISIVLSPGSSVSVDAKFRYDPAIIGALNQELITIEIQETDLGLGNTEAKNFKLVDETPYQIKATDYYVHVQSNSYKTLYLPSPVAVKEVVILSSLGGEQWVLIYPNDGELINNNEGYYSFYNYGGSTEAVRFASDGVNWWRVSGAD